MVELHTNRGLFYATKDGNYFLQARIFNIKDAIIDETENTLRKIRIDGLKNFDESTIDFISDSQEYLLYVFTDVTCGACRSFHKKMAMIQEAGISVKYLSFPREGLNGSVYQNAVSIWCSDNPKDAITKAKDGKKVAAIQCENRVREQYLFGRSIGVNATPTIILPNGSLQEGYPPINMLLNILEEQR